MWQSPFWDDKMPQKHCSLTYWTLCAPIKVIYISAPLIHDITSGNYNAQLVALGTVLRGGTGRTLPGSGPKYQHQRKTWFFLRNTSKEKWGRFLSLHQLFHQNFYPAVSGSPVQLSFCNPLPQQTWAHNPNILTHNTSALYTGTASQPRANMDRKQLSSQQNGPTVFPSLAD